MFYLSKIMTALIMPPGLIVAVMILILTLFSKKKTAFVLLCILTATLYLLSCRFVSESLLYPLESYALEYKREPLSEADLIIVLGGGSVLQKEDGQLENNLSPISAHRLLEGVLLQKETGIHLLFTGGNVLKGKDAPGEAEGVRKILQRYGLSHESYTLEKESRNTYENAVLSARERKERDIILVSSAFHLKRAELCFNDAGYNIKAFGIVDIRTDNKKVTILDFFPSMTALQDSFTALHEYWGLLYYKLYYF